MGNNDSIPEQPAHIVVQSDQNSLSEKKSRSFKLRTLGILTIVLFFALGAGAWFLTKNSVQADEIDILTSQLVKDKAQKKAKSEFEIKKMIDAAKKRQGLLLEKAKTNPKEFLEKATLTESREEFPEEAKPYIEKKTKVIGEIKVIHGDDFEGKKSFNVYNLKTGGKSSDYYVLNFADEPNNVTNGDIFDIDGVTLGQEITVKKADKSSVDGTSTKQVLTQAISNIKVAVIPVKFQNTTTTLFTPEEISSTMFTSDNSIQKYYQENSLGETSISGDVLGWYTIPYSVTGNSPCNIGAWESSVDSQVTASGVDLNNYHKKLYLFAMAGNIAAPYTCAIGASIPGGNAAYSFLNSPKIIAHELGHTLGTSHANFRACPPKAIDIPALCRHTEYGDIYDVMGGANTLVHFNGARKAQKGWVNPQLITTDGLYTVSPLEIDTSNPQVLKIAKPDTNEHYYISYRQKLGFDKNFFDDNPTKGASIHVAWSFSSLDSTYSLDASPSQSLSTVEYSDTALSDGSTFLDEINRISIKQVNHIISTETNPGSVTLEIKFIPLPTPTPTPTPSPSPTPQPSATPSDASFNRVFVTSDMFNGDLKTVGSSVGLGNAESGLDGADKICQSKANAENLGGMWKAWISNRDISASSRLTHSSKPYKLLNDFLVANNWDDLVTIKPDSTYLRNPINFTERRTTTPNFISVWTDTLANGSNNGSADCHYWTYNNTLIGVVGDPDFKDAKWTKNTDRALHPDCGTGNALYCFEETTNPSPTPSPSPTPTPSPTPYAIGYAIAETSADLDSIQEPATRVESFPVTIDYTFRNSDPGNKVLFVKFFYSDGASQVKFSSLIYRPQTPSPSPTQSPTLEPTASPSPTPEPTPTATPSPSPSPTPSPTPSPSPTPTPIPGDANSDGVVDIVDYSILQSEFGKHEPPELRADFNNDGQVDIVDYSILVKNFGSRL